MPHSKPYQYPSVAVQMTALLTPSTSSDITHSLEITRYPGHGKGEAYLSACGEDAWRMLFPGEGMLRDCEFVWMRYIVKHMDWGGGGGGWTWGGGCL